MRLTLHRIPGVFYLTSVFWIYKYCTDLVIFDREREDHMYNVVPYILSDFLSFLVPLVLWPTLYVVLVYFISHLRQDYLATRVFTMIASTVSVQFAVQGLSLLSASIFRSFAQASIVGNALNLFQLVSSGFLVTNVPEYVKWVRWISPFFYSFRIVATVQFKDRRFDCPAESAANLNQVSQSSQVFTLSSRCAVRRQCGAQWAQIRLQYQHWRLVRRPYRTRSRRICSSLPCALVAPLWRSQTCFGN